MKRYMHLLKLDKGIVKDKYLLLKELVKNHQQYIVFDSVTKIYCKELKKDYICPTLDEYSEYIYETGYGGTCINLTWGMYSLLTKLDYKVNIIKLESKEFYKHYSLVVTIDDKEYFIDVGFYMLPIYSVKPLRENWMEEHRLIKWSWDGEKGKLKFIGGSFQWNGKYLTETEFRNLWLRSFNNDNMWTKNVVLSKRNSLDNQFLLNGYLYKIIKRGKVIYQKDFLGDQISLVDVLHNVFHVDPSMYLFSLESSK